MGIADALKSAHQENRGISEGVAELDRFISDKEHQSRSEATARRMGEEMVSMAARMEFDDDNDRVVDTFGKPFDRIEVVELEDGRLDIWDGHTRLAAAKRAGISRFQYRARKGTRDDAFELSLRANAEQQHGMRRTNEDLRNALKRAMKRDKYWHYSDRRLAELCLTTAPTVKKYRVELAIEERRPIPETRIGRDGQEVEITVKHKYPWRQPEEVSTQKRLAAESDAENDAEDEDMVNPSQEASTDERPHPPSQDAKAGHVINDPANGPTQINVGGQRHTRDTRTVGDDSRSLSIHCGDFRDYMRGMEDESVDVVVSEGTSKRDRADLWHRMVKHGSRALRDGGVFLALTPQPVLPSVFQFLERSDLDYIWAVSIEWAEPVNFGGITSTYSPLLIYGRGVEVSSLTDRVEGVPRNFAGRREIGLMFANRFAKEGSDVVVPMCGDGGLAAGFSDAGCRVTAIDEDRERLNVLRKKT